jgi:hypothetical protein
MAKIKKYQMGGTPVKKYPGTNPKKIDTTKKAPYYDLRDDYKEPGAKKRESEMIKELKKKPAMPASKKNVGRKGIKVKAKNGKSFPDLNKDGKITKADILKGRGVIKNGGKMKAKGGAALKKQAATAIAMKKAGKSPKKAMGGMKMGKCKYGC